ncbi:hypothetical protein BKA64DRAFT_721828 [Cadophora sp. MPI-SDFR-AT-0126]|nr:hypothetical protein BKA64DRAFT_721828 [Leotiomycetes sp. MPI-SDFR-AT-0126]
MSLPVLRIGIIGCVEITQIVFISTLGFMSDYFQITYLCDPNIDALEHYRSRVQGGVPPHITHDAEELCASPHVDAVLVMSNYEDHVTHALLSLKYDKFALVEKPLAMCQRDVDAIIDAENRSQGKIFVGYIRRYAPAFVTAVEEIRNMDKILYARVRAIIGPNQTFISQSGTFPKTFTATERTLQDEKREEILSRALVGECSVEKTEKAVRLWSLLGGLGCHDISAMREAIGTPNSVLGVAFEFPFWNVLFQYAGFTVSYESGLIGVPNFDANIEVYSADKSVKVQYDSAYIKGTPTTLHVVENIDGAAKETHLRQTYEDEYTLELKEFYKVVTQGLPIKTSARDSKEDLGIFKMILQACQTAIPG